MKEQDLLKFALDDINTVYLGHRYVSEYTRGKEQQYLEFLNAIGDNGANPVYLLDRTMAYFTYLDRNRKNKRPMGIFFVTQNWKKALTTAIHYEDKRLPHHGFVTEYCTNLTARAIYNYYSTIQAGFDLINLVRGSYKGLVMNLSLPYYDNLEYLESYRRKIESNPTPQQILLLKGAKSMQPELLVFSNILKNLPKDPVDYAIYYIGLENLDKFSYNEDDLQNLLAFSDYLAKENLQWKITN